MLFVVRRVPVAMSSAWILVLCAVEEDEEDDRNSLPPITSFPSKIVILSGIGRLESWERV